VLKTVCIVTVSSLKQRVEVVCNLQGVEIGTSSGEDGHWNQIFQSRPIQDLDHIQDFECGGCVMHCP
jgi:hypothetical protein